MKELIRIQSELNVPKNNFNKFGNYYYRSCEDILAGLKDVLFKYECYVTLSDDITVVQDRIYVTATATIYSSKNETRSVQAVAREPKEQKGMNLAQITGSASSYARKYALNGLFAIDDTKDADTQDNTYKDSQNAPQSNTNYQSNNNASTTQHNNQDDDNKPWLAENSENWTAVEKYVLGQKATQFKDVVRTLRIKYKISKALTAKLEVIHGTD